MYLSAPGFMIKFDMWAPSVGLLANQIDLERVKMSAKTGTYVRN